jgi:hypothetical protein
MEQDIIQADRSIFRRYKDQGDGTYAEVVFAKNLAVDREILVTRYTVTTAFTGATVGNMIRRTDVIEMAPVPTVVVVLWSNESTGQDIAAPPSITAHLTSITMGDGLTQAQLVGSGLATAANQVAALGYLADLADNPHDPLAAFKVRNTEDLGTGTKYILKTNGQGQAWMMIKKAYGATGALFGFASVKNNPGLTTIAAAWAGRSAAVYGELADIL